MTVHKCFKCQKVYDCDNETVQCVNEEFFARLYGYDSHKALKEAGQILNVRECHENYDATCPYCAFKIILGKDYEPV